MITARLLAANVFWICFYNLIKSYSIYLGKELSYSKVIRATLMIIVLIDFIIQGIYQLLFFK